MDIIASGTLKSTKCVVGASPTPLPPYPMGNRVTLIVQLIGDGPVYLGGANVQTLGTFQGIMLPARYSTLTLEAKTSAALYGVSTTPQEVIVFEG